MKLQLMLNKYVKHNILCDLQKVITEQPHLTIRLSGHNKTDRLIQTKISKY